MAEWDVVVVGAGNAALCAALAARESGASVLVLERAPEDEGGGNTRFTAGAIRTVYNGVDDLRALMPDLTDEEVSITDFGTYTSDQFFDDMFRVTQFRTNPDMAEALVTRSYDTLMWMRGKGIRFQPIWGRQAFKVDGRFKFWGGLTVESWGGGPGLVEGLWTAARREGIEVRFSARVLELIYDDVAVTGVRVKTPTGVETVRAKAVVLAAGGFQANPEWRTRYLGAGWELAKVRGSRFNTGDGIRMALAIGAAPYGNWSGCHAVGWDYNAPEFGDLTVGDNFQKHSYPFGIMINADGRRFVDEGADFRNYTYAKYGRVILNQPNQFAWQVFDQKVTHLLRDEYRIRRVTKVTADTLEDLVTKLEGVNPQAALAELKAWNGAVMADVPFNPNVKDGRGTRGLGVPKSNWANTLDTPPYEAYQVTCGVTFTFGGLRIDGSGQVLDVDLAPIPGLYAAGELVGGLFYFNYPGGTGLCAGAVFGKIAGTGAGEAATGRAAQAAR
ncbi:MAG: FAD-dependent tricarballylate dehydrogenase TcuA [Thalassobaculum sp.]|uniref:FAD-dependent tricarballylate dehydrogenase TcuA n=1 Tax=Thalassobaculum sp. TaxID=2022740 RepID=UPI0032F00FDB